MNKLVKVMISAAALLITAGVAVTVIRFLKRKNEKDVGCVCSD